MENTKAQNTKLLRYFLINTFFVICIYFGFYEGVSEAKTLASVWAWFLITMSFLSLFLNDKLIADAGKNPLTPISRLFDVTFDLGIVIAFICAGAWTLGGFYFVHILFSMSFRDKLEKARADFLKAEQEDIKAQNVGKNLNFFDKQ